MSRCTSRQRQIELKGLWTSESGRNATPDIMQSPTIPVNAQSNWRFGLFLHLGRWEFPGGFGPRRA
jgi:hypothetical protein